MSSLRDRVDFSRIRYANCWEDAGVLLDSLHIAEKDRVLIIASAGDNAFATLIRNPEAVKAIDLSLPQLYLCELKRAAFAWLEYDELLVLLGVEGNKPDQRRALYQTLRARLTKAASSYWDGRRAVIEAGIMHCGKFERYFALFRHWLLPLVHSRATTQRLLSPKTDEEQAAFFDEHWNTWRWRQLMNVFFSRAVMGRYGRDPQFLRHVSLNVPQYIRAKAEGHLKLAAATENPFLYYIFTGTFSKDHLPVYLKEANFDIIKQNIGRLQLAEQDMDTAVLSAPYEIYCASNIFEYMSADMFTCLANRWSSAVPANARIAFWNLMAPRSFAAAAPGSWRPVGYVPKADMGFFYSRFLLEVKT
jgi:S-adenosylmethionine-diacylglycerol 3-amino-3-carboxypropyl transferase